MGGGGPGRGRDQVEGSSKSLTRRASEVNGLRDRSRGTTSTERGGLGGIQPRKRNAVGRQWGIQGAWRRISRSIWLAASGTIVHADCVAHRASHGEEVLGPAVPTTPSSSCREGDGKDGAAFSRCARHSAMDGMDRKAQ